MNQKPIQQQEKSHHISPQCGSKSAVVGERFYPPLDGASRAFGLPQAVAKRFFAGRSPHPLPFDRRQASPQDLRHRKQNKAKTSTVLTMKTPLVAGVYTGDEPAGLSGTLGGKSEAHHLHHTLWHEVQRR